MAIEPLAAGDPDQVAGYRLHGRLGAGGMGVVYLASRRAADRSPASRT
jgi:eukaryotic-like serine/threonine-protein kinase